MRCQIYALSDCSPARGARVTKVTIYACLPEKEIEIIEAEGEIAENFTEILNSELTHHYNV